MASSSSSSNMALPRANGSEYDVFLSFRGEDTRHSFTDHLYNALKQAGILTFRDSDDAERGEELKEEIEKAIKASDASIIVLSGNYATSTWCLDELSLILDQRRDCNHFVLPVFYNVDPSNVGKQKGSFEIQADPSRRRWTDDNVKRWKAALTEVVGVIGMTPVGSETKFIKEVVDTIYNRLDRKQIHIPANITGMDVRYEEINSLLKQSEAQFLVICGMAGSGKSTMAQFIVYSEGQQFESNSIVEKIGTRCKNSHEMVVLQEQLCNDISKGKLDRRIDTVCKGTAHIEVLLEKTKALIVLDEIVEERHLEELLGSGIINKESKIIITTNNDISNWFMSRSMRFHKYIMRLLNDDEALELLSLHAFRSKLPKDGYTELAQQVVRYCGGNPLSLEVLGSSLSEKDTITSWKSELSSFEKSFDDRMYEAFIRSYKSLPSSSEKELFLHIACFFVGSDMNYVVKILEPDYGAESKIKTLTRRCFLYVTPDNKLMMHRLLQEMGRSLVDRESRIISERTRVWRNKDSYEILRRKKISNTIEGLALDIRTLVKEDGFESRHLKELSTDSLQQMDQLKLLQLKFVKLTGSYEDLSEHLRWLYWVGFDESSVRTDIYMGNMVALDMSYSHLKEFEPPMNLPLLKILNLKDSHKLSEICNFHKIPNLETLILWNCHNLVRVCRTIGNLERLALLNTAGCEKLFNREELSFPLPRSLQRAFLNDCNLECTDYFPLSFIDQLFLQYINLANGHFESLPSYKLLTNLRVLDLRKCSRLQRLLCLPSTLAELYIYDCESIEKITFESGRFTLQEFGYEGCVILSEIEGWVKLLLITKLDGNGLEHMFWLKDYQHLEVCLVGDYELTKGRSCHLQMLYEFNIMSTSLPDIKHPKLTMEYTSRSTSLSFDVPLCPTRCRIKGLNVTFRYTISGDDWVWFVKIHTTKNVDLMYHPKVFGKPGSGNIGRWLSYWPIGNLLDVRDVVDVSIAVLSGLEVIECGASLVYTDDDVARDTVENKTGWVEAFGEDLYRFKLINGSYYLCQRDIYKLTQVGRLTPGWLSTLTGYTIDDTAVRGWRMTGRPQQSYQSFKELKTIRCITHEPDTYYQDTIQQQQQTQSRLGRVWDRFWSFFYQDTMSKNEVGEFKKDGLLWYHDIGKHGYGEYSMAVIQANQVLEDQCQIESGNFGTFVGVYDGHGGPDVARYACDNLFRHFQANSAESHGIVTPETIKKAFLETEKGFTSLVSQLWNSRPDIATVGSCCLVGVVYQQTLFVANVGDSRVVLGRKVGNTGGITAIQLSKEHNVNLENIRRELRDMHPLDPQIVVLKHGVWRVKGIIQVSRSIGDVYMKHARYNKVPIAAKFRLPEQTTMPILSASPSTLSHPIQPNDSFLIFASGGLWEHLSNDEAVDIVHNSPRAGVAKRLVKAALHEAAKKRAMRYSDLHKIDKGIRRHFHDDTTVIVLFLNHDLISRGSPNGHNVSLRSALEH